MTLSKISHEIRNPVTLINSFLQLLSEKHPEITEYEYWDDILDNMEYLINLLEELSSYNNSRRLSCKPVEMTPFLKKVASSFRTAPEYLNIHFEWEIPETLPVMNIDETKLRQALLNLLRNALEATESPGYIRLSSHIENDNLLISITDSGCGIPEESLSSIFQPFVTHKAEGTGLGLSIAQNVAEAHQGIITATSQKGQTSFTMCLPLHPL